MILNLSLPPLIVGSRLNYTIYTYQNMVDMSNREKTAYTFLKKEGEKTVRRIQDDIGFFYLS